MRRIFISLILIAFALSLIAGAMALFKGGSKANANTSVNETPPAADAQTNTSTVTAPVASAQADLLARARSFSELYGSWSADSLSGYVAGLSGWLTPRFAQTVTAPALDTNITSISAQALATKLSQWTESESATVVVTTRRTQTRVNEPSATYYENLTLNLAYQESQWLVDNAAWSASIVQPGGSGA